MKCKCVYRHAIVIWLNCASDDPLPLTCQVDNECTKAEQWLREGSQLQESLPKNVDPVLWSHEIKKMEEELDMYLFFPPLRPLFNRSSSFAKMFVVCIPDYLSKFA